MRARTSWSDDKEFGFEGIVAKRKNSLYESGKRTGAR